MGVLLRLPFFQSTDQAFELLQKKWASILNPLIENPGNQANILSGIKLVSGTNTINHLLGRKLQGYRIILKSASASIYDKQLTNQTPDITLQLVSDAAVTVSLEVF
jgi:hypothetical protein